MNRETRITLRLPFDVAELLAAQATTNNRSLNSEIVTRLSGPPAAQASRALRDWFAGHAPEPPLTWWAGSTPDCAGRAMWNYQYADAMLAAREGGAS